MLISLGHHPERLLPLVQAGIQTGAAIAFWSENQVASLPALVERPTEADEALEWADFIALEINEYDWQHVDEGLFSKLKRHASKAQLMVNIPTPCGIGGCQACSIPGRKSIHLACQTGLIHPLESILG